MEYFYLRISQVGANRTNIQEIQIKNNIGILHNLNLYNNNNEIRRYILLSRVTIDRLLLLINRFKMFNEVPLDLETGYGSGMIEIEIYHKKRHVSFIIPTEIDEATMFFSQNTSSIKQCTEFYKTVITFLKKIFRMYYE